MKRINVIGSAGSGKSYFSERLADKLECPCICLDKLFWKANWTEPTDQEFFAKLERATSGEAWVLDGNHAKANAIKWRNVDTIIWIDYPFVRTFLQLLRRTIKRAITKQELWEGTGNTESFKKSFLSSDSILIWLLRSYWKNKASYVELINDRSMSHINFIRLRSPNDTEAFLTNMDKVPQ